MRRPLLIMGVILGAVNALPFIGLDYLGRQWAGLPFVPFDVFDWLARILPGRMISVGIDAIVRLITTLGLGPIDSAAKGIEQLLGVTFVVTGAGLLGGVMVLIMRRTGWRGETVGALTGTAMFLVVSVVDMELRPQISVHPALGLLWLLLVTVGWGASLGAWLGSRELCAVGGAATAGGRQDRRDFMFKIAGACLGATLAAWGLARLTKTGLRAAGARRELPTLRGTAPEQGGGEAGAAQNEPAPTVEPANMRRAVAPAPGTRPEITSSETFYRIDIDTEPPVIEEDSWALEASGLFDRPRRLTLSDLLAFPAVTQPITLSCISNPVGGDLIGTSNWTGVPLRVVLGALGLQPEASALSIKAADGFYEVVTREDMLDPRTLLVYGMNGKTLPVEHGFPLRIYIPDRYGMKQPKWIVSMEALGHPGLGYWEERGWSIAARPHIVSVIDTVAKDRMQDGKVPIGGIAWAGDRGIQKVEIQVDGGPWMNARLRTPTLGPLTWVLWRYDWPPVRGRHVFRVRATDGTGKLQSKMARGAYPDGATGYHSVAVTI
jgi:DMSO/TMAO reductase YedYZ molybdopterin-dependent catalytic subunit